MDDAAHKRYVPRSSRLVGYASPPGMLARCFPLPMLAKVLYTHAQTSAFVPKCPR